MADFYVMETASCEVYQVYDCKILDGKTRFLIWKGYWKWIDARKTMPTQSPHIGG